MNIFFDIETIPCQDTALLMSMREEASAQLAADVDAVKAPANYKDADKIAAYIEAAQRELAASHEAKLADAVLKTSFDGGAGQICCIGWAVEDGESDSLSVTPERSERDVLRSFFEELMSLHRGNSGTRPVLVGHNSNAFDLPFIWKRSMIHGVRPPLWFPRDPKPWGETTFDTMTAWAGVRDRISMDKLCRILGVPGKGDGPTGADVWPMFQAGKHAEIAEYCRADVERTRAVWRRMNFIN